MAYNEMIQKGHGGIELHVHGRKKGDKWTKNQENVMAYNKMIQKGHGGIELEFNFADALGPDDVTVMRPIATAAAAAGSCCGR